MRKYIYSLFLFWSLYFSLSAQTTFDPSKQNQWLVDRFEIKSNQLSKYLHTTQKLYTRASIAQMIDSFGVSGAQLSKIDYQNLSYLQADNPDFSLSEAGKTSRKGIFYQQKSALYSVNTKDFDLYINPVFDLQFGRDKESGKNIYTNTRGIEVRGAISKKIGFYSLILENQQWMPNYMQQYINNHQGVVPGVGFVKTFKTGQFNNAYDFFNSRAYITFSPTKNILIQFGQDRNFIGNGYRSFILSDFANEYPFLKIQTKVWRFQYENLFAKMS
ncbi:MAG: hypothetical protein HYZ42_05940, partial [Bacteroidetes bacterium]|nr:hypothetical protein [Bacteroidota bacterium]